MGELPYCQPELLDLFDLLVDVIFCVKDADGRYLAVNNAFVRRTGMASKREVVGHRADEFFNPGLADRYRDQDERVFAAGRPLRDEIELIRRPDGSLGWYTTNKLPVSRGAAGTPVALVSISRDLKTPEASGEDAQALSRVVEYVRNNLEARIKVDDLAAAAGLTSSRLDSRMRKAFGLSPTKYVLRVRVDRAAELLAEPDIALADVAVRSGFYDQANLTHHFSRLTNETPAQFRANQQRLRGQFDR